MKTTDEDAKWMWKFITDKSHGNQNLSNKLFDRETGHEGQDRTQGLLDPCETKVPDSQHNIGLDNNNDPGVNNPGTPIPLPNSQLPKAIKTELYLIPRMLN